MERQSFTYRPARKHSPEVDDTTEKSLRPHSKLLVGVVAVAVAFSLVGSYQATGDPFCEINNKMFNPLAPDGVVVGGDSPAWYSVNTSLYSKESETKLAYGNSDEFRINEAKMLGFDIIDYRKYIGPIGLSTNNTDVLLHTSEFFSEYGINFSVPDEYIEMQHSTDKSATDKIRHDLKQRCLSVVLSFSRKPKELVSFSGLKSIQVVPDSDLQAHTLDPNTGAGYISYSDLYGTNDQIEESAIDSIIAIGIDRAINGTWGSLQDKTYAGANGDIGDDPYPESHDIKECYAEKIKFYAQNINGLDAYSIFEGGSRSKLLLVRLEDKLPNITKFLRAISMDSDDNWSNL